LTRARLGWKKKNSRRRHEFAIGVAVNPVADDLDNEIEKRFYAKIEAGAHYAMTQCRSSSLNTGTFS